MRQAGSPPRDPTVLQVLGQQSFGTRHPRGLDHQRVPEGHLVLALDARGGQDDRGSQSAFVSTKARSAAMQLESLRVEIVARPVPAAVPRRVFLSAIARRRADS